MEGDALTAPAPPVPLDAASVLVESENLRIHGSRPEAPPVPPEHHAMESARSVLGARNDRHGGADFQRRGRPSSHLALSWSGGRTYQQHGRAEGQRRPKRSWSQARWYRYALPLLIPCALAPSEGTRSVRSVE